MDAEFSTRIESWLSELSEISAQPSSPGWTSFSRAASPTTRIQNLQALEKPIEYVCLEEYATDQLPPDVRPLYDRIYDITVDRQAFLPVQVRDDISQAIGRQIQDMQISFEDVPQASALSEFQMIRDIQTAAHECMRLGRSESAWNLDVHGPLLKLALAQHRCVERELVTTARIAPSLLPPTIISGGLVENKTVDFVLVLAPDRSSEKGLAESIRSKIWSQPKYRFVNQTEYSPLQFRPIAVSIDTKVTGSAEEGRLQLAVWTAAWHQRMEDFLNSTTTQSEGKPIITLPLLLSFEYNWMLFFACDRGNSLEIVGEMSIGNTNTITGLYTVVAVVRELANWIDSTFRQWIIDALEL